VRIHRLETVDAFIAFDLDDCPTSAGGTRLAPDVTEVEVALLARTMTYKFGVLEAELGGAKGGIRAGGDERDEALARYCEEITPLVEAGTFLTGPDLGTSESDFAPLRKRGDRAPSVIESVVDGVPFEDVVTGFGVAVAAEAALGSLEGRTVALEGFGKVGGGVAREVARRGARLVAVSTLAGSVVDPGGLDVDRLWELRAAHGDGLVAHLGLDVLPTGALFDSDSDVLVPGARTGVVDEACAARLQAGAVVPAANAPYTAGGLATLKQRAIPAHADFVCNAGAVIGYRSPGRATPDQVLADVERLLSALVGEASEHPEGPFQGAVELAERFIRRWRGDDGLPAGPPLA
jgi:glutamate dehydrogenase (NAD(P)+)